MAKKKKKLTQDDWIIIITLGIISPICIIVMFIFGHRNSKDRQNIIDNGIETIGIIIEKRHGVRPRRHKIDYKFVVDTVLLYSQHDIRESAYDTIKIGSKYKVKYLPENPKKNGNSLLFASQPIKDNEAEW